MVATDTWGVGEVVGKHLAVQTTHSLPFFLPSLSSQGWSSGSVSLA